MAESDLYIPVRDWLLKRGYEVHAEVFGHDIIALKDGFATVVEMKLCLSHELSKQLHHSATWADYVIGAIASEPRYVGGMKSYGFGLLQITDGKCRCRAYPKRQPFGWHKRRLYRLKKLTGRIPAMEHEVAGLPSNPRLSEQRRLREKAIRDRMELRFNG